MLKHIENAKNYFMFVSCTNLQCNIKMVMFVGGTVAAGYDRPTGGAEGQKSCGQQSGQGCHHV